MAGPHKRQLRVLYTINTSSNYILARSLTPVSVTPINDGTDENQDYGVVPLKACLDEIRLSSPEYMQDSSRDFSVYVLDPLETKAAPAPLDISTTGTGGGSSGGEQSRGVAVGLGLMSRALLAEDSEPLTVVGTLGTTGAGRDAIEVIISLKEVIPMSRAQRFNSSSLASEPQLCAESSSSATPNSVSAAETRATIASIRNRAKSKAKPKKPPRAQSTVPVTESDKLLDASIYIGPAKKKGRPKGTKTEDSGVIQSQTTTELPPTQPSSIEISAVNTQPTPEKLSPTPPSSQTSQDSEHGQTSMPPGIDLATLAALFSVTQTDVAFNTSLLSTVGLIDSKENQVNQPAVNPALVEALKHFIAKVYPSAHSDITHTVAATSPAPSLPSSQPTPLLGPNDDVVLLDKENMKPTSVSRRVERNLSAKFGDEVRTIVSNSQSAPSNRGLGARSIVNSPPKAVPVVTHAAAPQSSLRKRTLDDCMEERDSKRNKNHKAKGKEKERMDKNFPRFLSQQPQQQENDFRHYPHLLPTSFSRPEPGSRSYYRMPLESWTSPPRPLREDVGSQAHTTDSLGGTSRNRPIVIPDSPQALRVSASSPIKPTVQSKKPYVMPEWAITDTATKPRLSEEAQRAKEEMEEKRRAERRAQRRKTNAAAQSRHRQRDRLTNAEIFTVPESDPIDPSQLHRDMQPPPLPVIPNSDLPPIIASSEADLNLFPPIPRRAQSPSPTRKTILIPPVTPQRSSRISSSTPGNPDFDEDSLFTPLSIARRSTGKVGTPLLSPGIQGSPCARKRSRISSPTTYRISPNQPGSESSTVTIKANETSEDTLYKSKSPIPLADPNDSQEELDAPPSSLPIASSDNEFEPIAPPLSAKQRINPDGDDPDEGYMLPPRKQHWVGLPPSSPPPPTSPGLMPIDDDLEFQAEDIGEELPVASETDEPEEIAGDEDMGQTTDDDSSPSPVDDDDLTITLPKTSDHTTYESEEVSGDVDEMAFFQQFTHLGSSDGFSEGHKGLPQTQNQDLMGDDLASFFNSGESMDLNAFLETLKPLVQDAGTIPNVQGPTPDFDFSSFDSPPSEGETPSGAVDHVKLAADLQAMFSGCLV